MEYSMEPTKKVLKILFSSILLNSEWNLIQLLVLIIIFFGSLKKSKLIFRIHDSTNSTIGSYIQKTLSFIFQILI